MSFRLIGVTVATQGMISDCDIRLALDPSLSAANTAVFRTVLTPNHRASLPIIIKILLGYASIQTTERHLRTRQNLTDASNDHREAGSEGRAAP
jgi:hypothetical protein